jgi:hypothetical protein
MRFWQQWPLLLCEGSRIMSISISDSEYKQAVNSIEKANERSRENNGHFKIVYDYSDSPVINEYSRTIKDIQTRLLAYCDVVDQECQKLEKLAEKKFAQEQDLQFGKSANLSTLLDWGNEIR